MSYDNKDQYIIQSKIGEGGMGTVYLAEDTTLQRPVAIKELIRKTTGDDAIESRFQQEALALARLNHPNITHLYAFLPKGETYWMVMEYVPGKTLEEWLHYHGKMSASLASSIVIQMLEGLQHAHRKGIIHRDLKPSNVMISSDGEVKIMDFGIARIRDSQRITKHGKSVGTLAYMAPEQIKGEEGDERTDIYAAGNILYELLSAHTPFEADTDYHLMKLKLEESPKPLSTLAAATPQELQKVIMKALDRNPAKRYESVAALREAIEHSMQGKLLKAEVLNSRLTDIQQEESFVQAVHENPLKKFSGMVKNLPVRAAADKISGGFRQLSGSSRQSKAWILLAVSAALCASLLFWNYHGSGTPAAADSTNTTTLDNPAINTMPEPVDTGAKKEQMPIIENQIMQNAPTQAGSYDAKKDAQGKDKDDADDKDDDDDAPAKKKASTSNDRDSRSATSRNNEGSSARDDNDNDRAARTPAPAASGPVDIPAGQEVRVVLDDNLSSEEEDKDGTQVHLHCDENVTVDGRVVIRRGAQVLGKIVDVRTSSNARRAALIGFVIQHIEAVDGTMIRLRSERFRNEADAKGQPVFYRRGQSFTAELGRGRID